MLSLDEEVMIYIADPNLIGSWDWVLIVVFVAMCVHIFITLLWMWYVCEICIAMHVRESSLNEEVMINIADPDLVGAES